MLQSCSLFSGSSGNSFLVKSEDTYILIDAGVSSKKIVDALASLHINIQDINAILITHEHVDHTKSIALLSSKYDIPIYANEATLSSFDTTKIPERNINVFNNEITFNINNLSITPFATPHDAASPCGFEISDGNHSMCVATDLGHVDSSIYKHFANSSFIMLESNYEPDILKISSYPYVLKQRISGEFGHLSNQSAAETICKLANLKLKQVLLVHLSKENNVPEIALETIKEKLYKENISPEQLKISIAPRNNPSKIFDVI